MQAPTRCHAMSNRHPGRPHFSPTRRRGEVHHEASALPAIHPRGRKTLSPSLVNLSLVITRQVLFSRGAHVQEPSCERSAGGVEGPGSQTKSQVKRTWWGWRRVAAPPAAAARWRLVIVRLWVGYSPRPLKKRTWWGWKRAAAPAAAARWRPLGGAPALLCPTPGPAAPRAQRLAPLPPHSLLPAPTPAPPLPPAFCLGPRWVHMSIAAEICLLS